MTTNEISTKSNGKGTVELSIPRIPGVRSEMVARITANPETFDCTLTRLRRDADGQESVLSGNNCKAYFRPARAMRAAKKFLEAELAR